MMRQANRQILVLASRKQANTSLASQKEATSMYYIHKGACLPAFLPARKPAESTVTGVKARRQPTAVGRLYISCRFVRHQAPYPQTNQNGETK